MRVAAHMALALSAPLVRGYAPPLPVLHRQQSWSHATSVALVALEPGVGPLGRWSKCTAADFDQQRQVHRRRRTSRPVMGAAGGQRRGPLGSMRRRLRQLAFCVLLFGRMLLSSGPAIAVGGGGAAATVAAGGSSAQVERSAPADVQQRTSRPPSLWVKLQRRQAASGGDDLLTTRVSAAHSGSGGSSSSSRRSASGTSDANGGSSTATPALVHVRATSDGAAPRLSTRADGGGAVSEAATASTASEGAQRLRSDRAPERLATIASAPERSLSSALGGTLSRLNNAWLEMRSHISAAERDTIVLLLAAALVTPAMGVIGLSPVLGFLFAGMILGPSGLAVIGDVETTMKLAELGVVRRLCLHPSALTLSPSTPSTPTLLLPPFCSHPFCPRSLRPTALHVVCPRPRRHAPPHAPPRAQVFFLFEMGLELELERLKSVGRDAFKLGTSQFVSTVLAIGGVAMACGMTSATALVIGGGLALSSSAFVLQLLSQKGELASRFGRASFGILLFQDLA